MTLDETIKNYEEVADVYEFRQIAEWLKELKRLKEQEPCEDCVSREFMYELGATCIATRDKNDKLIALGTIENLPSVAPKTKWIPVSDRLPEEGKVVLTQVKFKDNVKMAISSRVDYNYWTGFGTREVNVVAWMPLPKPYEE